jgi:hypothetical protein
LSNSRTLKLITGIGEGILAIPFLGGIIVVSFSWMPLIIMLILHIITMVISASERTSKSPSILGIVTSVIGWIPFVGWFMHLISAIVLLIAATGNSRSYFN